MSCLCLYVSGFVLDCAAGCVSESGKGAKNGFPPKHYVHSSLKPVCVSMVVSACFVSSKIEQCIYSAPDVLSK